MHDTDLLHTPLTALLTAVVLKTVPEIIFTFLLPLWSIHTKMLKERETAEETYAVHIAALQEQIQVLLDDNQLEEAKAVENPEDTKDRVFSLLNQGE